MDLDAAELARGWLAIYQATGANSDQPQLYKTLHIDQHTHGLRLVAVDGHMLLTTWVSAAGESAPEPDLDELPYASATVIDRHGRGTSLLSYLLKLADSDDHKGLEVTVRLNVPWQPDDTGDDLQIEGFEALAVIVEATEKEHLQLEVYEGRYPRWQIIATRSAGQRKARTESIALSASIAGRLSKAAKVFGAITPIKCWFGGKDKPVQVTFGDEPEVTGLVMPLRWDFLHDRPFADADAVDVDIDGEG